MFETATSMKSSRLEPPDRFVLRHIGPKTDQIKEMLNVLKLGNLDDLIAATVPDQIRTADALRLPQARGEYECQ
jgi:glycine dehydrogenase